MWPNPILNKLVSERRIITFTGKKIEDTFGGMFKLTGFNYSFWRSKMRDMLVVQDLLLSVQFEDGRQARLR